MSELIAFEKSNAVNGMEYFLSNFSHVPDDKLTYLVTPTAKSPIRIAAHTALYAGRFAQMIRDRALPKFESIEQWIAEREAEEMRLTSRVEMEEVFRHGTQAVLDAMDTLSEADLHVKFQATDGWAPPMTQIIRFPGWHATVHAGQIDFLQTCWGDQHIYVD